MDTQGNVLDGVEKVIELPQTVSAPVEEGAEVGKATYFLDGAQLGSVPILYAESIEKAKYPDYLKKIFGFFLL